VQNSLIDAGPIIALFDRDDTYHAKTVNFIKNFEGRLYTSCPVITEVSHMLNFNVNVQTDFLKWISSNVINIIEISEHGLERIIELLIKYSDLPMDLADGSLLWIAEEYNIHNIITIDSDYYIYRTKNKKILNNLF
jgi:predicted nucleic acid-binding protein